MPDDAPALAPGRKTHGLDTEGVGRLLPDSQPPVFFVKDKLRGHRFLVDTGGKSASFSFYTLTVGARMKFLQFKWPIDIISPPTATVLLPSTEVYIVCSRGYFSLRTLYIYYWDPTIYAISTCTSTYATDVELTHKLCCQFKVSLHLLQPQVSGPVCRHSLGNFGIGNLSPFIQPRTT